MTGYADNAIMAKVRALYGTRLKEEDYSKLLAAKSISEVASYLKNNTAYGPILAEVMEDLVHRGQLETMIRRRGLGIYTSLLHYTYGDKLFLTMYTMENEIKQLLLAIRYLTAGSMDRYIVGLPVYLARYTSFDLFALAGVKTYDDLLAVTRNCGYYPILAKFRPVTSDRRADITGCEKALLEYYYKTLLNIIKENYSGATRTSLERLLQAGIAFHNLSTAYRLKKYFGYPSAKIKESLLDIRTWINPKIYNPIINASDDTDLSSVIAELRVIKRLLPGWRESEREISINLSRARDNMCRKAFRFSTKPMVVVISYMYLLEIEVENIVNIIEGIRYHVSPDEIRALLVI